MIRVAVNGALGKMGVVTVAAVEAAADMTLVAALDKQDDLAVALKQQQPDVLIDFTLPECVFANTITAIEVGVRPVIGATGLSLDEIDTLQQQCAKQSLGGIVAPNFSISAVLMMQMAQQAARYLPDVEIIEMHHPDKVDAPSGTAKATAEMIALGREGEGILGSHPAARCVAGVPIHSLRMPGMFAHQHVIFSGAGERLTLQQDCTDRRAMMPGVLMAARYVMESSQLHYGLDKLFVRKS